MADRIFDRALANYIAIGGKRIDFTPLVGDPLVDPKIFQKIRRAKLAGFEVVFFTNGILLDKINIDDLLTCGIDIMMISTSPFDKESHELLYRTNIYDELIRGIRNLLERRKQLGKGLHLRIMYRAHIQLSKIL